MDDIPDEKTKLTILQAAVCNNLCDKNDKEKHKYCKSLMMDLEMDEMAKAGMFKTVIKKKEMYVKPALAYAKVVVKKLLEKVDDEGENLGPENIESIDQELKEFIDKNFDLSKASASAQKLLNKFGVNLDLENMLKDDPQKLIKAGMNIFNVVKEKFKNAQGKDKDGKSKMNFDIGSLLPEAQKILGSLMSPSSEGHLDLDGDVDGGDGEMEWLGDDEDEDDNGESFDYDYEDSSDIPAAGTLNDNTVKTEL